MTRADRISKMLLSKFSPTHLEVIDESHKHVGHAGARPEGETHYKIIISSSIFTGKNHVTCHRLINDALKDEFSTGLHALSIKVEKD